MNKYLKMLFFLLLSITLFSCKGPKGDIGLTGPQGENGTNGTNGTDGTNGENAYSRLYQIENNDQITKDDNSWTDYLVTDIVVDKDSSDILITVDMSAVGVSGTPEIAFRAKVGDLYSNPTLMKWITYNAIEKPSFTFLLQNINKGTYSAGVQWNALTGGITTSEFQEANSYNRVIITVY